VGKEAAAMADSREGKRSKETSPTRHLPRETMKEAMF
jgi:hypothetical protein